MRIQVTQPAASLFDLDDRQKWPGSVLEEHRTPAGRWRRFTWTPRDEAQVRQAIREAEGRRGPGWDYQNYGAAVSCAEAFAKRCRRALGEAP